MTNSSFGELLVHEMAKAYQIWYGIGMNLHEHTKGK